ncbi:MAG: hypothetical protein QM790_03480 [Nibricoccus sp.]
MDIDAAREAFYEARRTDELPLAVNDVVTVKEGRKVGARAWTIALEFVTPEPKYLIEYEDGSDEIIALVHLHRE